MIQPGRPKEISSAGLSGEAVSFISSVPGFKSVGVLLGELFFWSETVVSRFELI